MLGSGVGLREWATTVRVRVRARAKVRVRARVRVRVRVRQRLAVEQSIVKTEPPLSG